MPPDKNLRRPAIVGALVFLVATSVGAGGIVLWDWHSVALGPRDAAKRAEDWSLWCYEVGSGRRLNCQYTLKLRYDPQDPSGLLWNGGHMHPGRESSELAMGRLTCNGVLAKPPACEGYTYTKDSQVVSVWHEIPQVSGTVNGYYSAILPRGYHCIFPQECDASNTAFLASFSWDMAIPGLVELPADPAYIRCGKATDCVTDNQVFPEHPKPFFATPAMRNAVAALARSFRQRHPGWRLRILDLSLPKGGLMEDNPETHQWEPEHHWHRVGESVDIGLWAVDDTGSGVFFRFDELVKDLNSLIKEAALPLRRVVEKGEKIHY